MSTITDEQATAIEQFASTHPLTHGLGTADEPCTVAAINLALTGRLTDDIPQCMSVVIGDVAIKLQDAMPLEMINSLEWKTLLPLMAGTGRSRELERKNVLLDWVWGTVLPTLTGVAEDGGFGEEWAEMLAARDRKLARAAVGGASWAVGGAVWAAAAGSASWAAMRASRAGVDDYWSTVDPIGLVRRMIDVGR